ncbi:unnamed protein product [Agarophyton chilense]
MYFCPSASMKLAPLFMDPKLVLTISRRIFIGIISGESPNILSGLLDPNVLCVRLFSSTSNELPPPSPSQIRFADSSASQISNTGCLMHVAHVHPMRAANVLAKTSFIFKPLLMFVFVGNTDRYQTSAEIAPQTAAVVPPATAIFIYSVATPSHPTAAPPTLE